ncbi:MAG: hypothetical protein JWN15_3876 [Firmicutes bacterium]|nr:hypothetical protein [Bacillota bacterium]
MKKLIAGVALISTILGSGAAALAENTATTTTAQADASVQASSNLPNVTLTPDKLLYVLKMWAEKIQLVVTTDSASKAALLETQAQTRLAEARAMAQAGKPDLAQAALLDAKVKLAAAQKAIEAAAKTNKDMSTLTTKLAADQISFAGAINAMLAKAPDSVRAEFQPVAAELMLQIAANQDAAKQDKAAAKQAAKVAPAAPAASAAPAPATPAPATAAPVAVTKENVKAAVKAQAEAAKATEKATKAAAKSEAKAADDGEQDDDAVKVEASSQSGISFPLVNVKLHGEHGQQGQHGAKGEH